MRLCAKTVRGASSNALCLIAEIMVVAVVISLHSSLSFLRHSHKYANFSYWRGKEFNQMAQCQICFCASADAFKIIVCVTENMQRTLKPQPFGCLPTIDQPLPSLPPISNYQSANNAIDINIIV